MLTSIHFDDETYSDEIKRRLMKSLPMADVLPLAITAECSSSKGLRDSNQSNYTSVYAGQNA